MSFVISMSVSHHHLLNHPTYPETWYEQYALGGHSRSSNCVWE